MALTGDELEQASQHLLGLYREAEASILEQVTRRLDAGGMDATDMQARRLGQVSALRNGVQRTLDRTTTAAGSVLRDTIAGAYRTGAARATIGLPAAMWPDDATLAAAAGVRQIRADVLESLAAGLVRDVGVRSANVVRHVQDAYRSVIARGAAASVAGGLTRRQASQLAYQRFIDQGITSFTDIRGRQWRLSSYVEMGVRTVTQRAAVQGQTDRLQDLGLDLVLVSDSPNECPLCRPWEGKVLSISGQTPIGRQDMPSMVGPGTVSVTVDGTVDDARAGGLQHPQCTHSLRGFLPGATQRPGGSTANAEDYAAKQRQREIERNIRKHKERASGALTPEAAAQARAKTRAWQNEMRRHLAANPALKRLRHREQIGAGNIPRAGGRRGPITPADLPPPPAPPTFAARVAGLDPDAPGTRLAGGASSDTSLVTTPAGPVIRKKSPSWDDEQTGRDQADAELLAAQLAEALGVRAPQVARAGDDAVWMEWVESAGPPDDAWWDTPDGQRIGLLDMLSLNADRNGGNILRDGNGDLVAIDHGVAWQLQAYFDAPFPNNSPGVGSYVDDEGRYIPNPLTPADVDHVRGVLESLRSAFQAEGREQWLDYSLGVLDRLAEHASGTGSGLYG